MMPFGSEADRSAHATRRAQAMLRVLLAEMAVAGGTPGQRSAAPGRALRPTPQPMHVGLDCRIRAHFSDGY